MISDSRRDDLQRQAALLQTIERALARYEEILPLIARAADRTEAVAAVQSLLDVDGINAAAVLDLQWHRMTRDGHDRIAAELARIQALLAGPTETGPM